MPFDKTEYRECRICGNPMLPSDTQTHGRFSRCVSCRKKAALPKDDKEKAKLRRRIGRNTDKYELFQDK